MSLDANLITKKADFADFHQISRVLLRNRVKRPVDAAGAPLVQVFLLIGSLCLAANIATRRETFAVV
jgi:hypothetical protein